MVTDNTNLTTHAISAAFETPYVAYMFVPLVHKQVNVKGQEAYAMAGWPQQGLRFLRRRAAVDPV